MNRTVLCAMLLSGLAPLAFSSSVFTTRLDDPKAVYLSAQEFGAHGDGIADDSAAIQAAIDKSETGTREGIVFIPSSRYRLAHTVYVHPGVRVFGYGPTRPVFVLAALPVFSRAWETWSSSRAFADPLSAFPSLRPVPCRPTMP